MDLTQQDQAASKTNIITERRCPRCNSMGEEEGFETTSCCEQVVGSICFQNYLEETGLCCLCKAKRDEDPSRIKERCPLCNSTASEEDLEITACCKKIVGSVCFQGCMVEMAECFLCGQKPDECKRGSSAADLQKGYNYKYHFGVQPNIQQDTGIATQGKEKESMTGKVQDEEKEILFLLNVNDVRLATMNLSDPAREKETMEKIVELNGLRIKSLKEPSDIKCIRWNKRAKNIRKTGVSSLTIGFASATLANDFISIGMDWNGDLKSCSKQGPPPKPIQCERCQQYGHTENSCTQKRQCQFCAEEHESISYPNTPVGSSRNQRCCNCGGAHHAKDKSCLRRRQEEHRIRDENRFFPDKA